MKATVRSIHRTSKLYKNADLIKYVVRTATKIEISQKARDHKPRFANNKGVAEQLNMYVYQELRY